jgi:hypothetical protein
MGNNEGKTFFNIALTITLTGLILYFIQEMIFWLKVFPVTIGEQGVPITIVISAGLMIIAIISIILMLFMGFSKTKTVRFAIMIGALYLLAFTMVNFFVPFFLNSSWALPIANIVAFYANDVISFIVLLLMGIIAIFLFIISIMKMSEDRLTTTEQFTYIVTLGLILIYNVSSYSYQRYNLLGFSILFGYFGFFMLPIYFESILIALVIILLGIKVANGGSRVLNILGLILLNIFFLSFISITVPSTVLDITQSNDTVAFALGNYLILIGTVLTAIASIMMVKKK